MGVDSTRGADAVRPKAPEDRATAATARSVRALPLRPGARNALLGAGTGGAPPPGLFADARRSPGGAPGSPSPEPLRETPARGGLRSPGPTAAGRLPARVAWGAADAGSPGPGPERAALYSLALPGSGQYALGQRRWLAYAAAEGLALYLHFDRRGDGHDLRDAYRQLALDVARSGTGPAVVDDFEYYERMEGWTRSGAFDADPAATGVQPETDATTYNGAIWKRATEIFVGRPPDDTDPGLPGYADAVAYYENHAYPPELLWDWTGTGDARERFGSLIEQSDDKLREATVMAGLIVANHVLAAADAFVSARLREGTGGRVDGGLSLVHRGTLQGPTGPALSLRLEVRP